MRRFLIKTALKGKIEIIYDQHGLLWRIDYSGAVLTADQTTWLTCRVAAHIDNVNAAFDGTSVKLEESEFNATFADFRREYPYTRNAHLAEKFWPTMTAANQYRAFIEAIEYRKYCERNNIAPRFQKMADKWLREQQYLNDWKTL